MDYTRHYISPLGDLLLSSDGERLTGLWLAGQAHYAATLAPAHRAGDTPALREAGRWLDQYFSGEKPEHTPPLGLRGSPFRRAVWQALLAIPYGQVRTYGEIARQLAAVGDAPRPCPRAVGGAAGHNPISLIVPCHRLVGADGRLTGYAGGVERKKWLLEMEGACLPALNQNAGGSRGKTL